MLIGKEIILIFDNEEERNEQLKTYLKNGYKFTGLGSNIKGFMFRVKEPANK